jgi:hypothetical protein
LVLVSNGVYAAGGRAVYGTMTNRVVVNKPLELRSVNGPQFTVIQGYQVPGATNGNGAIRCVYLTNGASLSGFTLSNGATRSSGDYYRERSGGGVWCASADAVITDCTFTGNAAYFGGGVYLGTLDRCTLAGNTAYEGGATYSNLLSRCVLMGNLASYGGGGARYGALSNCTLLGNSAMYGGGAHSSTLNNCTLTGNSAHNGGGAAAGTLINCTLVGNTATNSGGGTHSSAINNCIVYFNSAPNGSNYDSGGLDYCCTTPMPDIGVGNITNLPLFVDQAGGNLRLQSNSPCINAGNNAYPTFTSDLDGNPRIRGGTVDIGAYEFQTPLSLLSYAWAQQYGLPTDGSADFVDTDGDRLNNWQEWRAGTVPTSAASVLKLLPPAPGAGGTVVSWQSVSNRTYFLERSTELAAQPAFTTVQSNLAGVSGITSCLDTNAVGDGPFFYRIGLQQ